MQGLKRKIIRLGNETYVVSLPSAWAKHNKLKKGDELDVEEQGSKLVLSPVSSESKHEKAGIDVSGAKPMVKRLIGALYKAGYDEFEVRFETAEELASVKEVMAEFVGFEIVEEGKNRVMVKNISHIIPDEFSNIQRKMISVIISMAEEGLNAGLAKDWDRLKAAASMDADVNRHADFCRRILNTAGHRVVKRVPPSYYIVEQLERISDSYRDLCNYCSANKIGIDRLNELYGKVNDFLKKFTKVYSSFDVQGITEFAKMHYELNGEINKLLQATDKKELPVLLHLKEAEKGIFDMNGALLAEKL